MQVAGDPTCHLPDRDRWEQDVGDIFFEVKQRVPRFFPQGSVAGASVSQTVQGTTEQEHRRHEFTMWRVRARCAGQATTAGQ